MSDEYVAEVLWFDPATRFGPERPGKIIDASMAWMEKAPIGTKLYDRPAQTAQREALSDADKKLRSSLIKIAADAIALRTWGESLTADASAKLDEQIAHLAIALRAAADGIGCQPKRDALSDAEIAKCALSVADPIAFAGRVAPDALREFARAIEKAHGIGGQP